MKQEIENQIHEFAERMYQAGYNDGYEELNKVALAGYSHGMKDAWECARKIAFDMTIKNLKACGLLANSDDEYEYSCYVINDYSASEAMDKINRFLREAQDGTD